MIWIRYLEHSGVKMMNKTVSRRTPEMEDIFSIEAQGGEGVGNAIWAGPVPAGRRTPDLDEIFEPDADVVGQQTPNSESVVACRGMLR